MSTILGISNIGRFTRIASTIQPPVVREVQPVAADIGALGLARYQLLRLRDAINEAKEIAGSSRVGRDGVVGINSSGALSLDNSTRAALLESNAEINTAPTSFSPFGPAWTGLGTSTALATIGGVYDGSGGTGTLRFEVRRGGDHGQDRLRIRVRDTDNSVLQNFTIQANDPIDQVYNLNNGLTFQLGPGALVRNDDFTLNVFDTVGSVVSTSNPFNGVRNANPNLDIGESVTGGTLTINGVGITVGAADSIDSIITAINQSGAGVTASFDIAQERLVLTQNTHGATPTVFIDSDDSGFASALKLSGAVVVAGKDADLDSPLVNVAQFQGVQSGTIVVNQTAIAIDVQTDSLSDILTRINTAQTQATATYSEPPQRVTFSSDLAVSLDDGGTGFLAALNIATGLFQAGRADGVSTSRNRAITQTADEVTRRLNGLLSAAAGRDALSALSTQLTGILAEAFASQTNALRGDFGLSLNSAATASSVDTRVLARNLSRNATATLQFLVGTESSLGLYDKLGARVDQAINDLNRQLGSAGFIVDTRA